MTSARMLGLCGLVASTLSMLGGFCHLDALIGAGGVVMLVGNVYAMVRA